MLRISRLPWISPGRDPHFPRAPWISLREIHTSHEPDCGWQREWGWKAIANGVGPSSCRDGNRARDIDIVRRVGSYIGRDGYRGRNLVALPWLCQSSRRGSWMMWGTEGSPSPSWANRNEVEVCPQGRHHPQPPRFDCATRIDQALNLTVAN